MEKITKTINASINETLNKLSQNISRVLEEDLDGDFAEIEKAQEQFEISRDRHLISGVPYALPNDHFQRVIITFSRLSQFFDSGVLLENCDGTWKAQANFQRGHCRSIRSSPRPIFSMPEVQILDMQITKASLILRQLGMQNLSTHNDDRIILVKVTHDFAYLLISSLPDLWLEDHLENIKKALYNCFND